MTLQYFCSLLVWYVENGLSYLFFEKLQNILVNTSVEMNPADLCILCFTCKKVNIPAVNCSARYNHGKLIVVCYKCKKESKFISIPSYKSVYTKGTCDLDAFLLG
ncbi:hypothetical protein NERG_02460 [Nematocida ausubeli]|uniref:Uncharacterized protein n=1 Tax=Nematocida ausubeli (strain ATCC PRA-371 / ERTm2) TaxID=1913371 RepID=H8ZFT9_NEMA1|nr:hypothetical protein NERG_02460 [Nematocida ausubeli]